MSLKLSVIVPMFKSEWCIADCIQSLYNQDLPEDEYEVIAVDNGSPDGCADYIRQLQVTHKNLRLISLAQNRLPSGARNAGIKAANGTYLMFVDSDDMLKTNVLKFLVDVISQDNLDFVHFIADVLKDGKIIENENKPSTPVVSGIELVVRGLIPKFGFDVSWGKVYKAQFLLENNLYFMEGLLYEDTEFTYRVYALAKRAKHIDMTPYLYRCNDMSATNNHGSYIAIQSDIFCICKMIDDIKQFRIEHVDEIFIRQLESCLRWTIHVVLTNYHQYKDLREKRHLLKLMRHNFHLSVLKYMSKKDFVLLKLGLLK